MLMPDVRNRVRSGGCQCGALRYALMSEPTHTSICWFWRPLFNSSRPPTKNANMLQRLSHQVRECYAHAKAAQSEPALRQSFLDAEQCWLRLVQRLASLPELEGD